MKVLLLNQCFWPDVVSTAQHLTDLAVELANRGHEVTVVAGDRGYDNPSRRFPRRETWRGIKIVRISELNHGKQTRMARALNFGSFLINCAFRLLFLPKFDAVIALTSPPLISFVGSLFVHLKGGRFFFWAMDLNPDEAIAAGWLNEPSLTARVLQGFLRYSLRQAERIIVLDRFMKNRILEKGISEERIVVLPPWSHDDAVRYDQKGREEFRRQHDLTDKFVVMYSGNHSPCHPLDTLLEAAGKLKEREEIVFCFVGGGSEKQKVEEFARINDLRNVRSFPYRRLADLSASLSAADLHLVVMGEAFVGIVHPCKIYNILSSGSPFVYIGPEQSHVVDIVKQLSGRNKTLSARHGEVDRVARFILEMAEDDVAGVSRPAPALAQQFSKDVLLPRLIDVLISVSSSAEVRNTEVTATKAQAASS
jgi:colanic acid biosynthesis glycosyl transferase WcaI